MRDNDDVGNLPNSSSIQRHSILDEIVDNFYSSKNEVCATSEFREALRLMSVSQDENYMQILCPFRVLDHSW